MRSKLRPGGKLIIEVPHARDFPLHFLDLDAFKNFTLWSQHLILNTRESLLRFMQCTGLLVEVIEGCQRYDIANHMTWAAKKDLAAIRAVSMDR